MPNMTLPTINVFDAMVEHFQASLDEARRTGGGVSSLLTDTFVTKSGSTYRVDMGSWSTTVSRKGGSYNGLTEGEVEVDDIRRLVLKDDGKLRYVLVIPTPNGGQITTSPIVKHTRT